MKERATLTLARLKADGCCDGRSRSRPLHARASSPEPRRARVPPGGAGSGGALIPFLLGHPKYATGTILERMTEPDRIIIFSVCWLDDDNNIRTNRAYRYTESCYDVRV